jgi:hypothetical protein
MKFSEAKFKAGVYNLQKTCGYIQLKMLYLGSLLHVDVKTVAYFKHW